MAIQFFDCKGFGQLEPSQVWFTRSGMIEAQCELDPEKFADHFPMTPANQAANKIYAEVGAFLMVDKANKIATVPTAALSAKGFPMGINYSTEKIYNQFTPGRRNFAMIAGEFLPRIGYVEPGMRICTNTVAWDEAYFEADVDEDDSPSVQLWKKVKEDLANGTTVRAYVTNASNGKLVIGAPLADAIGNVYAQIVEAYYNADNTLSFKIQFINKPTA
jgi:hypothetical protein